MKRLVVACVVVSSTLGSGALTAHAADAPIEVAPDELNQGSVDVEIFMEVHATQAQIDAVRSEIVRSASIKRFAYLDKDAALSEFQKIFRKSPDLIKNITAAQLPDSFRVDVQDERSVQSVAKHFRSLEGVDEVVTRPTPTSIAKQVKKLCKTFEQQRHEGFPDLEIFMDVNASKVLDPCGPKVHSVLAVC